MGARYLRGVALAVAIVGLLVPSAAIARAGSGSSGSRGSAGSSGSGGTAGSSGSGGTRSRHIHPLPGGGVGYDSGSPVGSGSSSNVTTPNVTIPKLSTGPNWGLILGLGLGLGIPGLIGLVALVSALGARKARREKHPE